MLFTVIIGSRPAKHICHCKTNKMNSYINIPNSYINIPKHACKPPIFIPFMQYAWHSFVRLG